jgi:hypothetical protein
MQIVIQLKTAGECDSWKIFSRVKNLVFKALKFYKSVSATNCQVVQTYTIVNLTIVLWSVNSVLELNNSLLKRVQ